MTDRKQIVKVINTDSELSNVASKVTQGSVLGPLLFLIYNNDLPNVHPSIECYGFPDYFEVVLENQEFRFREPNQIEEWCNKNCIKLNAKKCALLKIKGHLQCYLNGELLSFLDQKILKILISTNLHWNDNCELRASKATEAF